MLVSLEPGEVLVEDCSTAAVMIEVTTGAELEAVSLFKAGDSIVVVADMTGAAGSSPSGPSAIIA